MKSNEIAFEMKKYQQDTAESTLRERFAEDARMVRTNRLKINTQWRKILRMSKTEALKREIEVLSQTHERSVDRKDALIQMVLTDLEEAEDQIQAATRSHLKNIDVLMSINTSGMNELEKTYQKHLKMIEKDHETEMSRLKNQFETERKALKYSVDAIDKEEEQKQRDAQQAFEQLREEIRNRNVEEINMLRITLDTQIEELEKEFETAHLNYLQATGQRTHEYKDLAQNGKALSEDIERRKKHIDTLQMLMLQWRGKTRQLTEDSEERRRRLIGEKRNMQAHYAQLKSRINSYRAAQRERLAKLSSAAYNCKKKLTAKLQIAKMVINLGKLNESEETMKGTLRCNSISNISTDDEVDCQNEILSLTKSDDIILESFDNTNAHQKAENNDNSICNSFTQMGDKLSRFYVDYNHTLQETLAVEKRRDELRTQVEGMEDLICQLQRAQTIDKKTLIEPNTLLIVNGKTNVNIDTVNKNKSTISSDGRGFSKKPILLQEAVFLPLCRKMNNFNI